MPYIRDISLFLGRSSHSGKEVARIAFNADFTPEEQAMEEGFLMHILLVDINGAMDDFRVGPGGIYRRKDADEKDNIVGVIYRDIIYPDGAVLRVDRTRSWEFGKLGEGEEEFRALIALIPRNWEYNPAFVQSETVTIDLG
jgi:hypothetical protein